MRAWRLTGGRYDPTVLDAVVANGYDRSFADLLERTASRQAPGINRDDDPSVFYFSSNGAFGRMLDAVRQGHLLSQESWQAPVVPPAGLAGGVAGGMR